jgi:hypothetical protein
MILLHLVQTSFWLLLSFNYFTSHFWNGHFDNIIIIIKFVNYWSTNIINHSLIRYPNLLGIFVMDVMVVLKIIKLEVAFKVLPHNQNDFSFEIVKNFNRNFE